MILECGPAGSGEAREERESQGGGVSARPWGRRRRAGPSAAIAAVPIPHSTRACKWLTNYGGRVRA